MLLDIRLTPDDLYNFHFYTGWAAPARRVFRRNYYLRSIGYSFVGIMALFFIIRPHNLLMFLFIGILVAIIWGSLIAYWGINFSYKKKLRSYVKKQENSRFYSKTEYHITEAGFMVKDEDTETKINWKAIIKKAETTDYTYLYLGTNSAIIIPKNILTQEQKKELNVLLDKNLSISVGFNELQHISEN